MSRYLHGNTRRLEAHRQYCWMCKQMKATDYFTKRELAIFKQPFCEECYTASEATERPTPRELNDFGKELELREAKKPETCEICDHTSSNHAYKGQCDKCSCMNWTTPAIRLFNSYDNSGNAEATQ